MILVIRRTGNEALIKIIFAIANDWKTNIEVLNLSHMKIKKMDSLSGLVNLRQVTLSHNYIEKIEDLHNCKYIGELSLASFH